MVELERTVATSGLNSLSMKYSSDSVWIPKKEKKSFKFTDTSISKVLESLLKHAF